MTASPLKVALAIDHLGSGGAQRQVVEIACELARRPEVSVSVLVYSENDFFLERLEAAGVPLVRFPKRGKIDLGLPGRIARWLRDSSPDILHAFLLNPILWYLLAMRRLPARDRPAFLVAERDTGIGYNRIQPWQRRFLYHRCDGVTANSRPAAEAIHRVLGVPRDRVHYVPNGIHLDTWDHDAARPSPVALEPDLFHLALIGRLEPQKNHGLVLEALTRLGPERIRDWRVWFVGGRTGGRFSDSIDAEIERRGLGSVVHWLPPTPDIAALIRSLDGLLLPSHHEGFPNVLLEAMACGVPAIATPVGDVPSMLEDGTTGTLVGPTDADDLAQALCRLRDLSPQEREAMGTRAREIVVSRYRIETVADQYLEAYQAARLSAGER